jgi:DNA-binding beta-propeller fold protein YncE
LTTGARHRALDGAAASLLSLALPGSALVAGTAAGDAASRLFEVRSVSADASVVAWDEAALAASAARAALVIRDVPLGRHLAVDLALEPFRVTGERTRFVVGRRDGPDVPLDFDPRSVVFWRGSVRGRAGSAALVGIGPGFVTGYVDLGPGGGRYRLSSTEAAGEAPGPTMSSIFRARAPLEPPPGVPLCDLDGLAPDAPGSAAVPVGSPVPAAGPRHVELAVDTDYEFFELFGSAPEAAAYLVALYSEVSDIFARDLDARLELVYARLWLDPDDLYNTGTDSPLGAFRSYWEDHMGFVQRDVAQHLSGRRTFPFGGQAWVSALCGASGYSVVGYALGVFPDPTSPSPINYDVMVTAHELGHNFGTLHTHDYGIDACDDPTSVPQRGTIMSYCGQTWSGGNANHDNGFHRLVRPHVAEHLAESTCVAFDCNQNDVADAIDIQFAGIPDVNANGVPDECEDCNDNGQLDPAEIAQGAQDVDGDGVPDACQPDCNGNGVPDSRDIALRTSPDAYGNAIPDECEDDCDADGVSDYTEIQLAMDLDVDRDARLDACQDCDADGTPDLVELDGAHHVWVASGLAGRPLRQFHPVTGVLTALSSGVPVDEGHDVLITPGGNVWVSAAGANRVLEFTRTGAFVGEFVPPGAGGLAEPAGLALTTDGTKLLVASRASDSVLAYDAAAGTPLGAFVAAGAGGLDAPFGLTFGPTGNLFVTSATDAVLEYDGTTGAFVRTFAVTAPHGILADPRGLAFKPDGNLLVASFGSNGVIEFDGSSGANLGKWSKVGTTSVLTETSPWGIRIGYNGNVFVSRTGEEFASQPLFMPAHDHDHDHDHEFVSLIQDLHLSNAQIYEYDVRNGNFLRVYVGGNDHGLLFPTGFAFLPGFETDCDFDQLPDACNVAAGSPDANRDGVPDACRVDCDGNGVPDRLDLQPFGPAPDCNANGVPDACDVEGGASQDCAGNGIPDECEIDCNGSGLPDACDLLAATSPDCNVNGVPDECDVWSNLETSILGGWSTSPGDTATAGTWVAVNPIGTSAQTEYDHTPGSGRIAFVTGQGEINEASDASDVDGGKTTLVSPVIDLSTATDPELGYWRWFANHLGAGANTEVFTVGISNNGGQSWVVVEAIGPGGPEAAGGWRFHQFRVADFLPPTANMRLRFVAQDLGSDSIVEAAVDDLVVLPVCCEPLSAFTEIAVEEAGGDATLSWGAHPGAAFDVAGGTLSVLHLEGGVASAGCLAVDLRSVAWTDPRPDPAPGEGYYYLVRARTDCQTGSWGADSSGVEHDPACD